MNSEYCLRIEIDTSINVCGVYATIDTNRQGLENLKKIVSHLLDGSIKSSSKNITLILEETENPDTNDIVLVKVLKICIKENYKKNEPYLMIDVLIDSNACMTIYANKMGLKNFKNVINSLLTRPIKSLPDDSMLMFEELGGGGLTRDAPAKGHMLVSILKIYRWE